MSVWDKYSSRMEISGTTRRDETKKNAQRRLKNRNKESLSFQNVIIDDVERQATIIDSDNLNEKTILSTVGEDIKCGAMIEWANYHWIVKERDAHDEIYTRAKMLQCNYLLRWIDDNAVIHEQWCVIEDGTKLKWRCHNGLAYWKRYVKTTPLIAGIPLERYYQSRKMKYA